MATRMRRASPAYHLAVGSHPPGRSPLAGERSSGRATPPEQLAFAASTFEYAAAIEHSTPRSSIMMIRIDHDTGHVIVAVSSSAHRSQRRQSAAAVSAEELTARKGASYRAGCAGSSLDCSASDKLLNCIMRMQNRSELASY
jgi:hypothetical protein